MPQPDEIEALMRRCEAGCLSRLALDDAHQIMAECYRAIGALNAEVAHLRHALELQQESYERELAIERDQWRLAGRFREMPSAMQSRLWEQTSGDAPGAVELYERI